MSESQAHSELDAVVIGAGFAGLYMLHSLRDRLGLNVTVIEAGDGVGGTWYWNRYPGARCDSPSYIYCYTFDEDLRAEWEWSERYPQQPEILRYLEHCAERFDLQRDIRFGRRVVETTFDEDAGRWTVRTDTDETFTARYVIAATGSLSATNIPAFPGLDSFQGRAYHTSQWPHGGVDFTGQRVGVIGSGATAVQAIPEISLQAKHLTVFQRTANYCLPARNGKVDPEVVKARRADYDGLIERLRNSFFGFELEFMPESMLEVSDEERRREFDRMWDTGGFPFWLANYADLLFSQEANDVAAGYLRDKILATVHDPEVAEKLIPKRYPFGTKRVPLETNYFDTFNKPHVVLVDHEIDGPIEAVTPTGIRAGGQEYELDIIVIATGFDAMTGPLTRLNITGRGGRKLEDLWRDGVETYLGVSVAGFPNLFTINGPQSCSVLTNMPVSIQHHVEWITGCIDHLRRNELTTIEATDEAQAQWVAHTGEFVNQTLMVQANSWYMGANIPGKPRQFMPYLGPEGFAGYRRKCEEVAAKGYEGFTCSA